MQLGIVSLVPTRDECTDHAARKAHRTNEGSFLPAIARSLAQSCLVCEKISVSLPRIQDPKLADGCQTGTNKHKYVFHPVNLILLEFEAERSRMWPPHGSFRSSTVSRPKGFSLQLTILIFIHRISICSFSQLYVSHHLIKSQCRSSRPPPMFTILGAILNFFGAGSTLCSRLRKRGKQPAMPASKRR